MEKRSLRIAYYTDYIGSEYIQKIQKGAAAYCQEHNIDLISFPSGIICSEYKYTYQLMATAAHITPKNVDGIIFITGTQLYNATIDYVRSYMRSFEPLPIVSVSYALPDVPSIISDCKKGMHDIISHLITEHHCKRIALMGVSGNSAEGAEREKVYRSVLAENNIPVDESLCMYGMFTYSSAVKQLTNYLEAHGKIDFDAIVALNDDMAYGCIDFFRKHKIRVPEDVCVTGYDDLARSSFIVPSLTTVNQNIEWQGYCAAEEVHKLILKQEVPLLQEIESKAMFRQSCGCVHKETEKQANQAAVEATEITAQFSRVIHLYSDVQSDVSIEEFRSQMNGLLLPIGISAAAICFYNPPVSTDRFEYFTMPQSAMVLSAFDLSTGYSLDPKQKPIMFNPHEQLIPDGIFANMHNMYVGPLYRASVQYGYIVFRPGDLNMMVYNMVTNVFSGALAFAYNVTCAQEQKQKLEKEYDIANTISITDEMTGLLNRRGFMSLAHKSLEVAEATGQSGMVLYGDMDGLKKINDTYGHAAGDIAIKAEAKMLHDLFRSSDIIGRLGGDEFAITAPGMTEAKLVTIRKHLLDNCSKWNKTSGEPFTLSISMGVAEFSPTLKTYDIKTLLETADKSLYEEKKQKKTLRES